MKTFRILLLAALLGSGSAFAILFYSMQRWTPGPEHYPAEVRIEQGESLANVTRKLADRGLIFNGLLFSLWARATGAEKKIRQGLYYFDAPVPAREILDRLITGRGVFHTVTIPEGLTLREIAELLEKMQIADKDKFLAHTNDREFLAGFGLAGKGLEGYLFPSTYHFTPGASEKQIISAMIEQFRKNSLPLLAQSDGATALTAHELLTLASIIEKETGIESERPLVSAVFHNRLRQQMPLQSDPTVIYGIKEFDGNLTRKHLQESTPYNTYRIAALPPGPICNPGLSSIRAAMHPAAVGYLYFVSRNDGTHIFSETVEAHNQAVKTYQAPKETSGRAKGPRR